MSRGRLRGHSDFAGWQVGFVVGEKEVVAGRRYGKQPAKQLAVVRGSAVQPKWSPDGKHVAFVSEREGHSLIAIYDFDGASIRYLAPSVDKDSMPRWSPDGKWIVFVRTAGDEQKLPLIPVRPEPWALWIADTTTGAGRLLWRSGEKLEDSLPELTEDVSLSFLAPARAGLAFGTRGQSDRSPTAARSSAAPAAPGDATGAVGRGGAGVMNSGTIKTLTNSGTIRGGKGGSLLADGTGGAGVSIPARSRR